MGSHAISRKITCKGCPNYNTCSRPCKKIEKYLKTFRIYSSNWKGYGAFKDKKQYNYYIDGDYLRPSEKLKYEMRKRRKRIEIRCPRCHRKISYFREKDKRHICTYCGWKGKRPEKVRYIT